MASDGNIIQQAMEKVETLEDIKRGKFEYSNSDSDSEEPGQATEEDADIIEESEEDIPNEQEEDLKEQEE
jgi:hypothetical protein